MRLGGGVTFLVLGLVGAQAWWMVGSGQLGIPVLLNQQVVWRHGPWAVVSTLHRLGDPGWSGRLVWSRWPRFSTISKGVGETWALDGNCILFSRYRVSGDSQVLVACDERSLVEAYVGLGKAEYSGDALAVREIHDGQSIVVRRLTRAELLALARH